MTARGSCVPERRAARAVHSVRAGVLIIQRAPDGDAGARTSLSCARSEGSSERRSSHEELACAAAE